MQLSLSHIQSIFVSCESDVTTFLWCHRSKAPERDNFARCPSAKQSVWSTCTCTQITPWKPTCNGIFNIIFNTKIMKDENRFLWVTFVQMIESKTAICFNWDEHISQVLIIKVTVKGCNSAWCCVQPKDLHRTKIHVDAPNLLAGCQNQKQTTVTHARHDIVQYKPWKNYFSKTLHI